MRDIFTQKTRDIASAEIVEKQRILADDILKNPEMIAYAERNPAEACTFVEEALRGFVIHGDEVTTSEDMWKALMIFVQSETAQALARDISADKNVVRVVSSMQRYLVGQDKQDFGLFLPMTTFYKNMGGNARAIERLAGSTGDAKTDLMQLMMMLGK